ncbi:sirohydrochlorin chelatase [Loigolactobacillus coryniformis]|uniref:sirohydrochlorin chelatase n=1 Tax=Loigolactobacillus coryniformis TaxID=1610 RepID=UPI001C5E3D8E|nr:CbiX/SirB N-terminal domain-containing protein [Loigolactobacillus coryniformis]MBW4801899.1 transcriptional regulator [Loigolactobacillus coryniformis subsp. torquens]MBW4804613.1 transcriptional regulator [Loigolactobacillus coryniformis subsp. torquens]
MAQGILYVLHGRRNKVPQANLHLLQELMQELPQPQVIGFLEGEQQTLEAGLKQLQCQVNNVVVVPVLLFAATHVRQDLQRRLKACQKSGVTITVLEPLATTAAVFDFLKQQLAKACRVLPRRPILLIAHGTPHFVEPYQQLTNLAAQLQQHLPVSVIAANYIGPHQFAELLGDQIEPVIVQSLFLTDGRIAGKIKHAVQQQVPDALFLPTLENQLVVKQAILERLAMIMVPIQV